MICKNREVIPIFYFDFISSIIFHYRSLKVIREKNRKIKITQEDKNRTNLTPKKEEKSEFFFFF